MDANCNSRRLFQRNLNFYIRTYCTGLSVLLYINAGQIPIKFPCLQGVWVYEYHVFQKTSPLTSSHFFGNFFTISTIINLIVIHPCHCSCQFNIFLTYTHQYVLASRLINCKLIYDRHLYFLACKGYGPVKNDLVPGTAR